MTWRDRARPIIARVLKETVGKPEKEIRKALHDAYPWGQRAMHPYKVWCDEIRIQRGLKVKRIAPELRQAESSPEQAELFAAPRGGRSEGR